MFCVAFFLSFVDGLGQFWCQNEVRVGKKRSKMRSRCPLETTPEPSWFRHASSIAPGLLRDRFWVDFGSILEVILEAKIDNLGYRFCDHFREALFVAIGAFWNRFWSPFGVQRVTKSGNIEMQKSLFYPCKSYVFEV